MSDADEYELGARAHYEDAVYYDQAYRRRRHDVLWYAERAKESGGPVLELGCGTGRVTFGIAEAGVDVVGVDRMEPMLERARARAAKKPRRVRERIEWCRGDVTSLRMDRRFPLVVAPFNTWMHLYTRPQLEAGLATVAEHLAPGGRFLFDVLLPDAGALARDPARVYRAGRAKLPETGRTYHYRERFDYDPVTQVQSVDLAFVGIEDPADFHLVPLTHRQFFPQELAMVLHYNGFEVLAHEGDFDGEDLHPDAESQVLTCALRA